jgi:DnaJ-class molecular chaperone
MTNNPYTILGLHFNATREEVVAAYRAAAKASHPDQNPNDPEAAKRFTRLTEAYKSILENLEGKAARHPAEPDRQPGPTRVTLRRNVFLTVHEAMVGCRKPVDGVSGPCSTCSGQGRVPSPGPVECTACFGTGSAGQRTSGFIKLNIQCSECNGRGKVNWFSCHDCGGFGTLDMESCVVDIPPASRSGDRLVVPGGANRRRENVVGDVEITVVVRDRRFRINGNDIETAVRVDLWDAVLGCSVNVPTPSGGKVPLALPPETAHGTKFRIRGLGLNYTEERGDLVVAVVPKPLSLAAPGVREAMLLMKAASAGAAPRG